MVYKEYYLDEIATFKYGKMPKKDQISDNGFPIYTGYKFVGFYPEYNIEDESVIVVARGVGGTGDVKICPKKVYLTNLSIAVNFDPYIMNYKYFYYMFKLSNLRYLDTGSAQSQITINDLKRLKISIPSLEIQNNVIRILASLDDKIELNNKINKNLEKMAQTLYKRWFVDFEFPNEDGEPYKSSGGEMVESELGLIPKGWKINKLGELVKISYGKNYPTKNLLNRGFPVFGGNGIIGYSDKYLYSKAKVLVSCRGAASGKVLVSHKNSFVTNNSLVLEDNEVVSYEYLKELSLNREYNDFVSGSAQPQVTITSIQECKIILPSKSIIDMFSDVIKPLNEKIELIYYKNEKLAEIRDTLLPKLMSGEIEVPIGE